jgi:hypothetical protein
MAKNPKKKPRSGLMDKLMKPLKKQQVTLTKPGKTQAPMKKGKAVAKKRVTPAPPKTMREKQVQELKTLASIGKKNPERLAMIISKILQEAQDKDEDARLKFERLIWEKAEQRKPKRGDESK